MLKNLVLVLVLALPFFLSRPLVLGVTQPSSPPPPFPLLPLLVAADKLCHHPVPQPPADGLLVVHGSLLHTVHHGVLRNLSLKRLVQLLPDNAPRAPAAPLGSYIPLQAAVADPVSRGMPAVLTVVAGDVRLGIYGVVGGGAPWGGAPLAPNDVVSPAGDDLPAAAF